MRTGWMLVLGGILPLGCTGSAPLPPAAQPVPMRRPPAPLAVSPAPTLETRLHQEVTAWVGTPYRHGGESHQGIDCSGFTRLVYRAVLGLDLPRTAEEQVRWGRPVPTWDLRPGDLLAFHTPHPHVGIYLGEDAFAHASLSHGVVIANLRATHWQAAFRGARRNVTIP